MLGYGSFCLFLKCSVPKWELSMRVKCFSWEDPITPRYHSMYFFEKVSNRRVSDGLCEASKSHLTGGKTTQKQNSALFFQRKSFQPSYILWNMTEMFSFSSSAKEHQVFGTLKEAVKLNSCSLNFFTKQTRGEESKQDPGLAMGRALSWQEKDGAVQLHLLLQVPLYQPCCRGCPGTEVAASLIRLRNQSLLWADPLPIPAASNQFEKPSLSLLLVSVCCFPDQTRRMR